MKRHQDFLKRKKKYGGHGRRPRGELVFNTRNSYGLGTTNQNPYQDGCYAALSSFRSHNK
uniref:Uncharacterized protein n=1 Tax=Rhizophora mucronata TaxID=61149 RepID=A0A2P2NTP4_RHIMU